MFYCLFQNSLKKFKVRFIIKLNVIKLNINKKKRKLNKKKFK